MMHNRLSSASRRARPARRGWRSLGVPLLAVAGLAGALALWNASTDADTTPAASIFYSGEQRGYLEPCGCSKPMIGGLARRATYLKRIPSETPHLQVDNGDLVESVGRQNELKAEALAEFFKDTRYAAVNLGEGDYSLGFGYLRYLQSVAEVPLLSGNVVRGEGKPVFETHVLRTMQIGGKELSVAIVGLISPEFQERIAQWNPGFKVTPPQETLTTLKPQLQAAAKLIVLLYHGGLPEARELAKANPWLQMVVTAHEAEDYRVRAEHVGSVLVVNTGQKGKHLGRMDLRAGEDGAIRLEHRFPVEMSHEIPDDPPARAILDRYLSHVGDEGLLAQVAKRKSPNGQPFAGTKSCLTCHSEAHEVWEKSLHSHAWKTLIDVKHDKDPDCVGCHTVGLDYHGGFKSVAETPHLVNVGCENCHGPQGSHAKDPSIRPPKAGPASCATCHVPEHSPSFDFESFWKKIKH